jgi:hypothetical protein
MAHIDWIKMLQNKLNTSKNFYGKSYCPHLTINFIMKKTLTGLIAVVIISAAVYAQSEKQIKPPPPPPPPKIEKKELPPPPPPPTNTIIDEKIKVNEPPVITVKGKMADEFYKQNPSITDISRKGNIITLIKKDGTVEKYDMSKKEEDKSFTNKYGVSPIPPPPPPPAPPKPKKIS